LDRLLELHARYRDRVAFLFVYIRDAGHPDPAIFPNARQTKSIDPTPAESHQLLSRGLNHYDIPFPTLLDRRGEVERAYNAFPKRLVVVDSDGLIVYDGGRGESGGPSEWNLAEVERHLRVAQ
jgi:hypothetical protein